MNTLLFFCVFTFRVDRNVFFVENEKVPSSGRRRTIGFIQDKHYDLVLHSKCKNACVLFILTMICFAFFLWQEWQVLNSGTVLGHFQHCSVMRLSCLDELVNNDILLSLSFAWYVQQRRSSILVEPLAYIGWCFIFVFLFKKWQHLFWMEFCKRGVEEKS